MCNTGTGSIQHDELAYFVVDAENLNAYWELLNAFLENAVCLTWLSCFNIPTTYISWIFACYSILFNNYNLNLWHFYVHLLFQTWIKQWKWNTFLEKVNCYVCECNLYLLSLLCAMWIIIYLSIRVKKWYMFKKWYTSHFKFIKNFNFYQFFDT